MNPRALGLARVLAGTSAWAQITVRLSKPNVLAGHPCVLTATRAEPEPVWL